MLKYTYKDIMIISLIMIIFSLIIYVYLEKNYEYKFDDYIAFTITRMSGDPLLEKYANNGIRTDGFGEAYDREKYSKPVSIQRVLTHDELTELCSNAMQEHLDKIKKLPNDKNYAVGISVIGSNWTGDLKLSKMEENRIDKSLNIKTNVYTESNSIEDKHTYGIFIIPVDNHLDYSVILNR